MKATEGPRIQNLQVEDTVRLMLRTQAGVMGSIDLSWSMNKEQPYFLSVYGSQGTLQVGWKDSRYRRSTDEDWIRFGEGYNRIEALRGQIENFTQAIRGEDTLLVRRDDELASVEMIESAYASLEEDCWLAVNQDRHEAEVARGQDLVLAAGLVS